jgi:hypothetical protein
VFVRPTRRALPVALALLLAATAFAAHGSVPPGYQVQSSTRLANGVDHEVLTLADPAQSVHVARVAPGAARFVTVSSHDVVANQPVGAELPSGMCHRVGCYAGITADFTDAGRGEPLGGVVSGGRLLRSPIPGRPQLNVLRDGRLAAGPLDWSGSLSGNGRTVSVRGVNVGSRPGEVVLYTPEWGGITPEGADTELVVRSAGAVGAIGATTSLQIVGVRSEPGSVPSDGAVLAASGSAAAVLHEFADRAAAGGNQFLDLRISTAIDVVESVGGAPVLLRNGQPAFPDVDDNFTRDRHPRSLVGWNAAGEVVLATVDGGRDGAASGMTLAESAELLRGLGASDGFGFNHSSATFVAAGEVKNRPVEGAAPALNAFMVVPKPAGPAPTNPGPGNNSGSGGTTATTAAPKLTTAGGGSAPGTGVAAAPAAPGTTAGPGGPATTSNGKNTQAKKPRRQVGKHNKGKKAEHGEEEIVGDPSIPDWNDITAALTPEAVAAAPESDELSLDLGGTGGDEAGTNAGLVLLQLVAAGMIGTVLWGLRRAYDEARPSRALWY